MLCADRPANLSRRRAVLTGVVTAAVLAGVPAVTHASVIVYRCGDTDTSLCAIDPDSGKPRTLIDKSADSIVGDPSITADGKTFAVKMAVKSDPPGTRIVSGSTGITSPVKDGHDVKQLHDLLPFRPATGDGYYAGVVLTPDPSSFTYTIQHDTAMPTGEVHRVQGGVDTQIFQQQGDAPDLTTFDGAPMYLTGNSTTGFTCLATPANPCQAFPVALKVVGGSSASSKYLLTFEPAGKDPFGDQNLHVRDAQSQKIVSPAFFDSSGSLSPDDRFLVLAQQVGQGNDSVTEIVPVDGSAAPREIARGFFSSPVWGGTMESPTKIAGSSAPSIGAPARVPGGAVRTGIRLVIKAPKGTRITARATVKGKQVGTASVAARSGSTALRLHLTKSGAARSRRAKKVRITAKVGSTFTIHKTVRVR